MKIHFNYIAVCFLTISSCLYSQDDKLTRANIKYNSMSYADAIKLYNGLVNDGLGSAEIFENLGNSYYLQSNYQLAKESYDSLFKKTDAVSLSTYYRYINVLRSTKKYGEADIMYSKLLLKFPQEKIENNVKNTIFLSPEVLLVESINLKKSNINSPYSDYKVSYLGDDKIVFSSSKETKKFNSIKSIWNNEAYTNLYESSLVSDSLTGISTKLKGSVNKLYNESSAVFTKDGRTMYFTRNNQLKSKFETDSLKNVLLKIYKATFDGKRWGKIEELPFNSNQFNCAHPALSADEDYLYFSSDMPGSFGDSDLYRVSIKNNTYGEPENLGSTINTKGRDTFPFVTSNNILIFSSDYRKGLGGLDLYYVNLNDNSKKVYTFSKPINSSYDDFGLIYKQSNGKGFLTSNRIQDNASSDDIYEFTGFSIPTVSDYNLTIKSSNNTDLIGSTAVSVFDGNNNLIGTLKSLNNVVTISGVDLSKKYHLQIINDQYQPIHLPLKIDDSGTLSITLQEKEPENAQLDLRNILKLNNIYFDFDKSNVREDALLELQKVVDILIKYPEIKIDIIGHTDSIGASSYNEKLSIKRANATKQWLVGKGISEDRLNALGFGEEKPINDCLLSKKCTNVDYEKNRRIEFLIRLK
ncbi:OmpA family protein [Polaribacter gangjinensis]|uniref:OmpA-like domain-containing protein n=1 Tax=Polaribacter gangjinensis TaxID=574710 RepID=A0A2S7WE69_9FLAO|nr:OmpA family protein [Polaribacter gangjinensis]PQJ75903.1 hypothetical protein BTO13_12015 [Polaribacter gangjinensis]